MYTMHTLSYFLKCSFFLQSPERCKGGCYHDALQSAESSGASQTAVLHRSNSKRLVSGLGLLPSRMWCTTPRSWLVPMSM